MIPGSLWNRVLFQDGWASFQFIIGAENPGFTTLKNQLRRKSDEFKLSGGVGFIEVFA